MSDESDSLEAEMSRMRPRGLTPELNDRIAVTLSGGGHNWPDRFLLAAIGSGAIAACVIALMLLGQPSWQSSPPAIMARTSLPRVGDWTVSAEPREDLLATASK